MNEKKYRELADKYMGKMLAVLSEAGILENTDLDPIGDIICSCVIDSMKAGKQFSFEVAQFESRIEIAGLATHWYWTVKAGFADMKEALTYRDTLKEAQPENRYTVLVDGIPLEDEDLTQTIEQR